MQVINSFAKPCRVLSYGAFSVLMLSCASSCSAQPSSLVQPSSSAQPATKLVSTTAVTAAFALPKMPYDVPPKIDESKIVQTFYVAPTGKDSAAGTLAAPFGTIQKAVDASGSKATKIVLADGTYRNYIEVKKGDNLLIFEAKNTGKAIISGADIVKDWKALAENEKVFAREWKEKWGLNTENSWWGSTPYNRRREMVYLNEDRLVQRVNEKGDAVAPGELKAGEFTIDESANRVLVRPPSGVDLNKSTVEMSMRGRDTSFYPQTQAYSRPLFKIDHHSNIVLRGLVVKRGAQAMKFGAALHMEGSQEVRSAAELPENVLVDRCTVIDNNAIGMEINNYRNVTVRNSVFNDNGERGAGMLQVGAEQNADPKTRTFAPRNYLFTNCRFNDNNWRMAGTWGDMNDSAGFKAFGQCANGLTFIRCQFNGNIANGFWQDYAGSNTFFDRCIAENNSGTGAGGYGMLSEMTRGPITIINSVIRNNTNAGFISSGAPNVTIQNSFLYGNNFTPGANNNYNCQEIRVNSDTGRGGGDFDFGLKGWKLIGNTFQSRGGDLDGKPVLGQIFQFGGDKFPDGLSPAAQFAKYVVSENNTFSKNPTDHANGTGFKIWYSPTLEAKEGKPNITLEEWQKQPNANGKQDQKSKFVWPLDLSKTLDPTKVATKPAVAKPDVTKPTVVKTAAKASGAATTP